MRPKTKPPTTIPKMDAMTSICDLATCTLCIGVRQLYRQEGSLWGGGVGQSTHYIAIADGGHSHHGPVKRRKILLKVAFTLTTLRVLLPGAPCSAAELHCCMHECTRAKLQREITVTRSDWFLGFWMPNCRSTQPMCSSPYAST